MSIVSLVGTAENTWPSHSLSLILDFGSPFRAVSEYLRAVFRIPRDGKRDDRGSVRGRIPFCTGTARSTAPLEKRGRSVLLLSAERHEMRLVLQPCRISCRRIRHPLRYGSGHYGTEAAVRYGVVRGGQYGTEFGTVGGSPKSTLDCLICICFSSARSFR